MDAPRSARGAGDDPLRAGTSGYAAGRADPQDGVRPAAQQVLARLVDIGRTRAELLTVELEEERLRLARMTFAAALALLLLVAGIVFAAACAVMLVDPAHRAAALGVVAVVLLAAAGLAAWAGRRIARRSPAFLGATLEQLARDRDALAGVES